MGDLIELNEIIKSSGHKKKYLAACIGISPQNFTDKIHGRRDFHFPEVMMLAQVLNIPAEKVADIFLPSMIEK